MKNVKVKLNKNKMSIKQITVTNDDDSTQVFVDQATIPAPTPVVELETITIPLNTPIEVVAK